MWRSWEAPWRTTSDWSRVRAYERWIEHPDPAALRPGLHQGPPPGLSLLGWLAKLLLQMGNHAAIHLGDPLRPADPGGKQCGTRCSHLGMLLSARLVLPGERQPPASVSPRAQGLWAYPSGIPAGHVPLPSDRPGLWLWAKRGEDQGRICTGGPQAVHGTDGRLLLRLRGGQQWLCGRLLRSQLWCDELHPVRVWKSCMRHPQTAPQLEKSQYFLRCPPDLDHPLGVPGGEKGGGHQGIEGLWPRCGTDGCGDLAEDEGAWGKPLEQLRCDRESKENTGGPPAGVFLQNAPAVWRPIRLLWVPLWGGKYPCHPERAARPFTRFTGCCRGNRGHSRSRQHESGQSPEASKAWGGKSPENPESWEDDPDLRLGSSGGHLETPGGKVAGRWSDRCAYSAAWNARSWSAPLQAVL